MNTNVKAVVNLMQTLGVTLDDVKKAMSPAAVKAEEDDDFPCGEDFVSTVSSPPADKIAYGKTANGMTYAKCDGKVLGLVFNQNKNSFVLSLYNNGRNIEITQAQRKAAAMPAPKDKTWIVPSDTHWREMQSSGFVQINTALQELGGDPLERSTGYLSTTSQANCPTHWVVRFVLPLA